MKMNKPCSPLSLLLLLLLVSAIAVDAHDIICKCHRIGHGGGGGHHKGGGGHHKGDGHHKGGTNGNNSGAQQGGQGSTGGDNSGSQQGGQGSTGGGDNSGVQQGGTGVGDNSSTQHGGQGSTGGGGNSGAQQGGQGSTGGGDNSGSQQGGQGSTGGDNSAAKQGGQGSTGSGDNSGAQQGGQGSTAGGDNSGAQQDGQGSTSGGDNSGVQQGGQQQSDQGSTGGDNAQQGQGGDNSGAQNGGGQSNQGNTGSDNSGVQQGGQSSSSSSTPPSDSSSSSSPVVVGGSGKGGIGVCFGQSGDNLPSPSVILQLLKSRGISKVRLFVPIPAVLTALKGTGIKIMIGVPNDNIVKLSLGGVNVAVEWLKTNILAFVNPTQVCYIAVGDEVFQRDPLVVPHVVPCMYNLHKALQMSGLDATIKLSSPCSSNILGVAMPPSAGAFDPFCLPFVRPMLKFLSETGAPLMVNMHPFQRFVQEPAKVGLNFCLFKQDASPVQDAGLHYTNMFDATVDALVAAMAREGFASIKVVVTGTGWPTTGNNNAATKDNAEAYVQGIVQRASQGMGTPKRPNQPVEVFLSNAFSENVEGGGNEYEKDFALFNHDGSLAVNVNY